MKEIIGDLCHDGLVKTMEHALAFDEKRDYAEWKEQVREKLSELLRIKQIEKNACPLNMEIEEDIMLDGYRRIRFVFESEKGAFVPCYLCIPDTGKEKYPVAITLQGHSSGFHNSIGIKKYEKDESLSSPWSVCVASGKERLCGAFAGTSGNRRTKDGAYKCGYTYVCISLVESV